MALATAGSLRFDVVDSTEQVLCLLAICQLVDLPEAVVEPFLAAYVAELRGTHAERVAGIQRAKALDKADQQALLEAAREVARSLAI